MLNDRESEPATEEDRNKRLMQILGHVLSLEAAARRQYLEACQERWLRRELEALLEEAEALPKEFLETPPEVARQQAKRLRRQTEGLVSSTSVKSLPHRLGPYRILRQLGRGGMGTVYLGEQQKPVERRVALKVIDAIYNRRSRHRFTSECQALARLSHPNVASLYEVGMTDEENPYVVMELIEGKMITTWCDEHKLSIRARIGLFLGACAGIKHAHEKSILHRDLKPSNVLVTEVDGHPTAKVIDFGIARSLDNRPLSDTQTPTVESQLVGSPAYMSPEAASGQRDLDTRTDVYALGLLLYELLADVLPFSAEDESLPDLLRRIALQVRPAPSERYARLEPEERTEVAADRGLTAERLERELRGELDAIVGKAVALDREDRYGSPADLMTDLEAYLDHRPVKAMGPRFGYRLSKTIRRHRAAVAAAGLLAAALVAGVVATSLALVRAREAESRALHNFTQAQQVVNDFLTDVSENDLLEAPGAQPVRRQLLERALRYYESFISQRHDDPAVRLELAKANIRVGRIHDELGTQQHALEPLERAVELLESLVAENPDEPDYRYHLADATHRAAWAYYHNGQAEKAFVVGLRALKLQEALVADYPLGTAYRELLAHGLADRSESLEVTGQDQAAVELSERSVRLLAALHREHATSGRYRADLAQAHSRHGGFLFRVGRLEEALESHRAALVLYRRLLEENPRHRTYRARYARGLSSAAETYLSLEDYASARETLHESLATWRELRETYPSLQEYQYGHSLDLKHLAKLHRGLGDLPRSVELFRQSTDLLRSLRERNPANLVYQLQLSHQLNGMSQVLHQAEDHPAAIATAREAVALFEDYLAGNPSVQDVRQGVVDGLRVLAASLYASGQREQAISEQERLLETLASIRGDARITLLLRRQRSADALQLARWYLRASRERPGDASRALELAKSALEASGDDNAAQLETLAIAYQRKGDLAAATATLGKALARSGDGAPSLTRAELETRLDELWQAL